MGGTSQKLNNYIFANIPSIVSKSKDTIKFNKNYNTSIITDGDYKQIAEKTNYILKNKKNYQSKVIRNKQAFLKTFNFEEQIKDLEKLIF